MSQVFLFNVFHSRSFSPWWPLAFLILSTPLQIFHVFLPKKSPLFLSLALALFSSSSSYSRSFLAELPWLVVYVIFFSLQRALSFVTAGEKSCSDSCLKLLYNGHLLQRRLSSAPKVAFVEWFDFIPNRGRDS